MTTPKRTPKPYHAPVTDEAMQTFVNWVNDLRRRFFAENFPNATMEPIAAWRGGKTYTKLVAMRDGQPASVFCFVENATGAIIKAATFKAPEPKLYERGNIHKPEDWANWIQWTGPVYLN